MFHEVSQILPVFMKISLRDALVGICSANPNLAWDNAGKKKKNVINKIVVCKCFFSNRSFVLSALILFAVLVLLFIPVKWSFRKVEEEHEGTGFLTIFPVPRWKLTSCCLECGRARRHLFFFFSVSVCWWDKREGNLKKKPTKQQFGQILA